MLWLGYTESVNKQYNQLVHEFDGLGVQRELMYYLDLIKLRIEAVLSTSSTLYLSLKFFLKFLKKFIFRWISKYLYLPFTKIETGSSRFANKHK